MSNSFELLKSDIVENTAALWQQQIEQLMVHLDKNDRVEMAVWQELNNLCEAIETAQTNIRRLTQDNA